MLTNSEIVGVTQRYVRLLFSVIDRLVYALVGLIFDVFFQIASQDIISGEFSRALIGRFQLIIGIVFIFVFAIHILQGIINPSVFTDSNKGSSKLILKVIVALMLFASMIPLSISGEEGSWNAKLGDQGILFGTMSYFQDKVLEQNILGKLVLGNENSTGNFGIEVCDGDECSSDVSIGGYTATSIIKLFVFPNMLPGATSVEQEEDGNLMAMCINDEGFYNDTDDPAARGRYQWYVEETNAPDILGYVDNECTIPDDADWTELFSSFTDAIKPNIFGMINPFGGVGGGIVNVWQRYQGEQHWQFQYLAPLSTAVGIFVIVMMFSFCLEIAVRVFKLVILRILGPIAAISYAIPSEKNKMFDSWVANVTSTYLDIFIRLAVLYFIIFVISTVLRSGVGLEGAGIIATIIIIIALFSFVRQAPRYVRQVLGLPEEGRGLFGTLTSGLGTMFGGIGRVAGLGAAGLGAIGAARMAARSSRDSDTERQRLGETIDPNSRANRAKHFLAGAVGLGRGAYAGGRAALTADGNSVGAASDAINALNTRNIGYGQSGSSLRGRTMERLNTLLSGESALAASDRRIALLNARANAAKDYSDYITGKGVGKYSGQAMDLSGNDSYGNSFNMRGVSLDQILNARQKALTDGDSTFTAGGETWDVKGERTDDMIKQFQGRLGQVWVNNNSAGDAGYDNKHRTAEELGVFAVANDPTDGIPTLFTSADDLNDSYKLNKLSGKFKGDAAREENGAERARLKANQPNRN